MGARGRIAFAYFLFPFAFLLVSAAGCRNCDFVEAELRSRESELRELHADLARSESQNEALLRELAAIRQGTATKLSPEFASQTFTLKQITLGRGTGGLDEDDCPGDEALQVVLEPRDGDGHTIKAPGSVHIEALEISPEGVKTPLSSWDLPPDQVRHTWRSGLLSTGYFLVLPWKNWPSSDKLRIITQFALADGRLFEADKDVTIRLTPIARRKITPLGEPAEGTRPIESGPLLPPPRKLESKPPSTSKAWSLPPTGSADSGEAPKPSTVQPAAVWRPKPAPPLAESVELLRPAQLKYQPGEEP